MLISQYTIDDYQHLNQEYTKEAILQALQVGPLYVQVGLHPYHVQLHTPDCQDPIRAGFDRPTFAGVLTGYNMTIPNEEFWEMYIRRHGDNYNKVKLACVFEKCTENGCEQRPPFAGLASKMYQIEVVGEIKPIGTVEIPASGDTMITDTESLKQVIEAAGGSIFQKSGMKPISADSASWVKPSSSFRYIQLRTASYSSSVTCRSRGAGRAPMGVY